MPLQIIPQQNQPVGLQLLGDAINSGAADYAARRDQERLRQQALADDARRRGYQLSDVASNRTYEQQQFDKVRLLQLADEQRKRGESLTDAGKRAQMENRLRLLTEAESRGLFDARQIGNAVAEDTALTQLQTQLAKEAQFSQGQPANAQARLEQLGQTEQAITQKMSEVEARLAAQPTIDNRAVMAKAEQLATQANGGKLPNRDQIQAAYSDALASAQQEAQVRWYQDKQDAQVQYQILSSQLNTIRQQQQNLTSTFKVAPTAATSVLATPPAAPVTVNMPQGNPLDAFTRELSERVGAPPTATSNDGPSVQNITSALSIAPPAESPQPAPESYASAGPLSLYDPTLDPLLNRVADWMRNPPGTDPQQKMAQLQTTPAVQARMTPQAKSELMTRLLQSDAALQNRNPASGFPRPQWTPGALLSDRY